MNCALAFGFFKLVHFALFYQLPTILTSRFDPAYNYMIFWSYLNLFMMGGIPYGVVSDLSGGRKACVLATFMGLLCPLLFVPANYMGKLTFVNMAHLAGAMGFLLGGPLIVLNSQVAIQLADNIRMKSNKKAVGTITGTIDGCSLLIAALGQLTIPILHKMGVTNGVGYKYVWYLLIVCTVLGTALMSPLIYKECYPETHTPLNKKA